MNARIDLHVHSHFSDGLFSPAQLVEMAKEKGITAFSLTDHDTMEGNEEAAFFAKKHNIEVISGVEISAHHDGHAVHILGYGIDRNSAFFSRVLDNIQFDRHARNEKIIEKLNKLKISVSLNDLTPKPKGQIGRPHIARLLVNNGVVRDENEAFSRLLGKDKAAYVQRKILPVKQAVSDIKNAGGLAFWAHPGGLGLSQINFEKMAKEFKEYGLSGLEIFHPVHNQKIITFMQNICNNYSFLISGGSDFHGKSKDRASMGESGYNQPIPYYLFKELKKRHHEYYSNCR